MIDSKELLEDLQREVTTLEDDLRSRCDAEPTVDAPLKTRYDEARARNRTALTYKAWREEELTNVAVAWVLACVFVRFLEDNGLIDTLHLAGTDAAGVVRARDQQIVFFREHPLSTEREYLEHVFTVTAALPSMAEFFDRRHNPLWSVGPTGDASAALVNFWRRADPETGRPVHDFADPDQYHSRLLGMILAGAKNTISKNLGSRTLQLREVATPTSFHQPRPVDPATPRHHRHRCSKDAY